MTYRKDPGTDALETYRKQHGHWPSDKEAAAKCTVCFQNAVEDKVQPVPGQTRLTEQFIVSDDGEKLVMISCQQLLPTTADEMLRAFYEQVDWDGSHSEDGSEVVLVAAKLPDDSKDGYTLVQMTRAEMKKIERSEQ